MPIDSVSSLKSFFKQSVHAALDQQEVRASEDAACYIVNLLASFSRSEDFFEETENGLELKPLAFMFADVVESPTILDRERALRRLGDVSLFVSGMLSRSLVRKPVGMRYYISMGGAAYANLFELSQTRKRALEFSGIFSELSMKFSDFVAVLNIVADSAKRCSKSDLISLYDLWINTGSKRAARELTRLGVALNQATLQQSH